MALIECRFFSQVLGLMSTMNVILPNLPPLEVEANRVPRQRPYPTLYLLHGLSDDHTVWQRRTQIERYVEAFDLAVVMPAVQRSFYANSVTGEMYWTFISEEVPLAARSFFPLSAAREENYVAGLSMGGYGAFKLALACPERFAAGASLSGALDIVYRLQEEEKIGGDAVQRVFGSSGRLAGSPDDLFRLARETALRGAQPSLYQWCGTDDFLYEDNRRFREHARAVGLAVTYEEGPGGHEWPCWDQQIQRVLNWLPGLRRL